MSAALQLPMLWATGSAVADGLDLERPLSLKPLKPFQPVDPRLKKPVQRAMPEPIAPPAPNALLVHKIQPAQKALPVKQEEPESSLVFYRKHTEKLLRRYLYASMQVGRAPSILSDPVARGWVSSRPVRSFEDAVIFVLDVEKCLSQLTTLDRQIISRVVLQEYTQAEAAALLGMSLRSISTKLAAAMDRLTQRLLASGVLLLPR